MVLFERGFALECLLLISLIENMSNIIYIILYYIIGAWGGVVLKALRY